jgi:hypothetical protein
MSSKPKRTIGAANESKSQRRESNVSAAPLTPDQLVKGIFQIKPDDVKRVLASKPGKKRE